MGDRLLGQCGSILTAARCTPAVVSNLVMELLDAVFEVEEPLQAAPNTQWHRVGLLWSLDVTVNAGGNLRIRGMEYYSMHSSVYTQVTAVEDMTFAARPLLGM